VGSPFDTAVTCRARTRRSSPPPAMPGSPSRPRADARTKDAPTTVASLRRVNGSTLSTDGSDLDASMPPRTARGPAGSRPLAPHPRRGLSDGAPARPRRV